MYNKSQIIEWLLSNVKLINRNGSEYQFNCPICDHKSNYFNITKLVGYCHRASCNEHFDINKLIEIFGSSPDSFIPKYFYPDEKEFIRLEKISLPSGSQPIIHKKEGQLLTNFPNEIERIYKTRFITAKQMFEWNIHLDTEKDRVIVPIYEDGILKNYISRAAWWFKGKTDYMRYDYPKGLNVKDLIFGWEEVRTWEKISVVENTFNAIWLRDKINCTTLFGSDISKIQINKIHKSNIKKVLFFWDYGAEIRAEKACRKLQKLGIEAKLVRLNESKQQPDNFSAEELQELFNNL